MNSKEILKYILSLEKEIDELKEYKTRCIELEIENEELKLDLDNANEKINDLEISIENDYELKKVDIYSEYGVRESDFCWNYLTNQIWKEKILLNLKYGNLSRKYMTGIKKSNN